MCEGCPVMHLLFLLPPNCVFPSQYNPFYGWFAVLMQMFIDEGKVVKEEEQDSSNPQLRKGEVRCLTCHTILTYFYKYEEFVEDSD